jgi:putative hydrolase of the HAD superfamily
MTSLPSGINTIIFDLGGVLVDLSVSKTIHAFSHVSGLPPDKIAEAYHQYPGFLAYERGELNDNEFRMMLKEVFSLKVGDHDLDTCWNAMLVELPESKLRMLESLKENFTVLALSNTNAIHIHYVNTILLSGRSLNSFFHHCYYSHEVGMRKPETRIYEHVLNDYKLNASQTIFLDDNIENIRAANTLGIQTLHITHPDQVFDLLK